MLLERFDDAKLAQVSYMVGCQRTGEALMIDATRDIAQYMSAAAAQGLRITHVTETHIHADFVSGSRELAQRTGATLLLSNEGDADWKYAYATDANATLLHDGDVFMIGNIRIDVMHVPGHTPEHLAFVVTDTPAGAGAMGVFTGDFVFVGDVGRPDLLERAANVAGTMEASARAMFRSLQRFRALPDHLQLWPGHGAGSACGKALGAVPASTLGYEKLANWGFTIRDEDAFVKEVLSGQPEPPTYFAAMKRINRDGPPMRGDPVRPPQLGVDHMEMLLNDGAFIVDTRPSAAFASRAIPGSISIPRGRSFITWAGWLMPLDRDVYLITGDTSDDRAAVDDAVHDLAMIGIDRVAGWWSTEVIDEYAARGHPLQQVAQVTAHDVSRAMADGSVTVIDVRGASEYEAGHLPGARNIPVGHLTDRLSELPATQSLVLHCQGGARSMIGASVLQSRGLAKVVNMIGGIDAWRAAGLPIEGTTASETETDRLPDG